MTDRLIDKFSTQQSKDWISKLSSTFCGAKYYNATIWLGSGQTTSCHHPLPHQIPLEGLDENPSLIHNTHQKKAERAAMKCGIQPDGCNYCWRVENKDPSATSDRVLKTRIYTEEELEYAFNAPADEDFNLRTLEIAFDRTCNLACSYCNPAFSTTWVKDIKNNGAYTGLETDGRRHFTHAHDSSQPYPPNQLGAKAKQENPYVEAFFKWWDTDLHKTLRELRVTGGEPMMSGDFWRLVDWFRDNADKSQTSLAVNSNLICKPEMLGRLMEAADNLPSLDVYTSCEAMNAHAEYIRDGFNFQTWANNLEKLNKHPKINTHVMCTVNALCLKTLPHLLEGLMLARREYGMSAGIFSLNILRFPSFQALDVLPREALDSATSGLVYVNEKYGHVMHEFEKDQVVRLVNYISMCDTPDNIDALQRDFKRFYEQYDRRRGKDFRNTFTHLTKWYDSIETKG